MSAKSSRRYMRACIVEKSCPARSVNSPRRSIGEAISDGGTPVQPEAMPRGRSGCSSRKSTWSSTSCGRAALVVGPEDERVAHDDCALAQDPVDEPRVVAASTRGRTRGRRRGAGRPVARHARACGPSITSSFRRRSSERQRPPARSWPRRAGARAAARSRRRSRSRTASPVTTTFGFQPSQPVARRSIATGAPSAPREPLGDLGAPGLDAREHDVAHREEHDAGSATSAATAMPTNRGESGAASDEARTSLGRIRARQA